MVPDNSQHADLLRPTTSTLTEQEVESAHLAKYDLGPGYPQLEVDEYIRRLYLDDTIEELSLQFAPVWSPHKQAQVDLNLELSVRAFLKIPNDVREAVRPTFSGSTALDRAITGLTSTKLGVGNGTVTVITTSPCIDIMKYFLEEHANVVPHFVESRHNEVVGAIDEMAFVETVQEIAKRGVDGSCIVLISSPENPTGRVWTHEGLKVLADACAACGATLVVDHCFAVAGVQHSDDFPRIWDIDQAQCEWLGIWDTGKTFGLNEDKLGFLIPGSSRVANSIDRALSVLQFGVARRQKLFFTELLRLAGYFGHVSRLQSICAQNLAYVEQKAPALLCGPPEGGSLALIDVGKMGFVDSDARSMLLREGIGTVAASVFFHTDWRPDHMVRIALARRPEYFREAFDSMIGLLDEVR